MSCKIFYSAVENKTHWDCATEAGCSRFLLSYFYLDKADPNLIKRRKEENPEYEFLIDSGAHTLQKGVGINYEDFLKRYSEWIECNRKYIYAAVELDIDNVVGNEQVRRWQEKYFNPLERRGIPIVYVWHASRGVREIEMMAREHDFIGVNLASIDKLPMVFAAARKYLTRVHGFAITRAEPLSRFPFATADSTTWKAGERFGDFYWWTGTEMDLFTDKAYRRRYKSQMEALGIDWEKIEKDDNYELSKHNATQFLRMEDACAKRTQAMNYWEARVPHPRKMKKLPDEKMVEILGSLGITPEMIGESEADARKEAMQVSRLQWGFYNKFYENYDEEWYNWILGSGADDGTVPLVAAPDEEMFHKWRVELNAKLVSKTVAAQPRLNAEDFRPSSPIKRRPEYEMPEQQDGLTEEELDKLNHFYEE